MSPQMWALCFLGAYWFLFIAVVGGVFLIRIRRRKERAPLEFTLLRQAGETLRQKVAKMDEDFAEHLLFAAFFGPTVGLIFFSALHTLGVHNVGLLIVPAVALILGTLAAGRRLHSRLDTRRHCQLGYLGEREVGEQLMPLLAQGYFIFHDVPAEAKGAKFNIDHVVVGKTGVFAIETKTRRKRKTKLLPDRKEHVVTFDGQMLAWPWGDDRKALEQAERQARWLAEWVTKMIGTSITVMPMVALPGWFVELRGRGTVGVQNPKNLPGVILASKSATLTPDQIDLIARQLDARCRDVTG